MPGRRIWLNLALAAALGAVAGWWLWWKPQENLAQQTVARLPGPEPVKVEASTPPDTTGLSFDEQNNIEIYKAVSPAVVNITITTIQFDFFSAVPVRGSGSGFLIDEQGNIVTNYHVISDADAVEVTLADHSRHPAKYVGGDPMTDLAVIKIDARRPLPAVKLGDSSKLQVGQKVLAIGNPFGLESTLSTGIISSLGRSIRDERGTVLEDLIQTDAAINPGNSGGPLLNSRGEVIGVNTAIIGQANVGIGFALPINAVRSVASDLVRYGRVRQAFFGAVTQQINPTVARILGLAAPQGLLIAEIARGGPAEQAGLRAGRQAVLIGGQQVVIGGDLIVELDGTPIRTTAELSRYLRTKQPGDLARVTLFRGNQRMTVEVRLGDRGEAR